MSDVFLSYARSTEPQVKDIAQALRAEGFSVWRDDEIPAHKPYAEVIEERLRSSKAVLVIWSADAAKSQWVRAEADAARELGTLIQVTVDGTLPPLPFNQIQCAQIGCSEGAIRSDGWERLTSSVATLVNGELDQSAGAERARIPRENAICVLPFINMSGDPEQEYFSDGISEDITTDLSKVSALDVIARNTALTLKGQSLDICDVARTLGVSHVVEGSVRKAGSRVRISAQLIDGRTGSHVWAERYDRELTDIFAIQDEISQAIVEALKIKLLPEERKAIEDRGTSSAEAYNLYLMARKYWLSGNYGDVRRDQRVIRICRRAVEIDPSYARAWALMAISQANLYFTHGNKDESALPAAERALEIEPSIAEAHCVKARYLLESGHAREANQEVELALRLGPESWEVNREAARLYYWQRRIPEATRYFEKAVRIFESDFHAWGMLASCYEALGDRQGVLRAAQNMVVQSQRVLTEDPSNAAALGIGAGGLAIQGELERTREWIERALLIDPDNLLMRYNFACVTTLYLNDPDAALDLLEYIFQRMSATFFRSASSDPDLDSLRDHPRFRKIAAEARKRLGLIT